MLRSYKTEIEPTFEQKQIINRTIGVCRYIYNFYLAHNQKIYETEKRFVSAMEFSKWLNNERELNTQNQNKVKLALEKIVYNLNQVME